jgi:hypothetical protein
VDGFAEAGEPGTDELGIAAAGTAKPPDAAVSGGRGRRAQPSRKYSVSNIAAVTITAVAMSESTSIQ